MAAPARLLGFGARYAVPGEGPASLVKVDAGDLVMPSGGLVMADALTYLLEDQPLVQLRPGTYPVTIAALAHGPSERFPDGHRRGAAVLVGELGPVTQWRVAEARFGLDYGVGVLFDASLADAVRAERGDPLTDDELGPATYRNTFTRLVHDGWPVGVAFDCGLGGGGYPVLSGADASGSVVAALADLELLDHQGDPLPDEG